MRSLLYAIPVAMVVLMLFHDLCSGSTAPASTNHETLSFNMALNARFCGATDRLSSRYSPYLFLTARHDLMSHPFVDAVEAEAGSVAVYCRSVTEPYFVSENSLMWLARWWLWADPALTPDGLGRRLAAARVVMLMAFGLALIWGGAPLLFTTAAVLAGCAILRQVGVRDTPYPFVMTLPLLLAAAYGWARSTRFAKQQGVGLWVFALSTGVLTAWSAGMRTILLPMGAAMFGVFLFALYKGREASQGAPRALALLGVAAVAFGLGYAAYAGAFVERLRYTRDPAVSDYAYHTFAHPLVLGLAVPESEFTRREEIRWDDMAGLALARRIVPGVTLLGPEYETALLRYYGLLWRKHPREMVTVYALKLREAGNGVFLSMANVAEQFGISGRFAARLHRVTNGVVLLGLGLIAFGTALARHLRWGSSRQLIAALVSLAALTALGEAFLMHSTFVGIYSSELLFFLCFVFLIAVQAAVDVVARNSLAAV